MTKDQFQQAANIGAGLASRWFPHIDATFKEFGITSAVDQAMFIAQFGHESAGFTQVVESFNYSVAGLQSTFGKRLSKDQCAMLGRQRGESVVPVNRQAAIANLVYSGRMGNKAAGDGWKYRGRGIPQITGLDNYRACSAALKADFVLVPELLERDEYAMRAAGWFWSANKCGRFGTDVAAVTKVINGGLNGIDDRKTRFEIASKALA
ncbi:glycoside hydrolase family 19 protein [Serratia fonticola]|uniref:glycoside hydrolase family 19 protein n=1 Tax=Serratia fonticola TaxID=47917 RepID=UPI0021785426|nr:glycoside hydrolase family 19 protein [Serratia fonticola]CAI1592036.1 Predicted chitinase [Serratia fonticola]CAI1906677.1 Predicted chitinase [Serratia fonticola]CAI1925371.1 Predicted chitinase [Serratia fonticola]